MGILHEFIHTVLFEKKRAWGSTPQAWADGPLITMENAVSLRTEVMVYHRWPSLRKHTFEQPIWADTLMQSSWPVIKAQRKRIQNTSPQERSNLTPEEQRIAGYVNFNKHWGQLWTDAGITIEAAWQYTYNHPDETQEVFEKVWASHEQHGIPFYHLMP